MKETRKLTVTAVKARREENPNRKLRVHLFCDAKWAEELTDKDYRQVLRNTLPDVFARFLWRPMPERLTWSRKAGCSCGCSPGFVGSRGCWDGYTIYADVK